MTYICAPIFVTVPDDNGVTVDLIPSSGIDVAIPSGPKGLDGVSPTIEVTDILGGHKVTITDVNGTEDFNVMDGGISESDFLKVFPTDTASGAIATFPDGADQVPLKTLTVAIDPVQNLNGYDNPWPAGGGKNKFDKTMVTPTSSIGVAQNENGFVLTCLSAGSYKSIAVYIPFTGHDGEELYLKGGIVNSGSNNGYFSVRFYDDSAEIGGQSARLEVYSSRPTHQRTVPTGTTRIACVIYVTASASASVNDTTTFNSIMLSLTDSAYSPYSNICPISGWIEAKIWVKPTHDTSATPTATIQLGETVYGGTLDVLTGVLTVTKANIASYNGETLPGEWISDRDVYAPGTTPTTGAQVVYELATPFTVQLTAQQVSSLLGANNVWADTGDVSVVYRADIGLFIDKKLNA